MGARRIADPHGAANTRATGWLSHRSSCPLGELGRMESEPGGDLGQGEFILEQLTYDPGFEVGVDLSHGSESI